MNEIFHRTSIRKFEDKPVEQEKIDKILRAGFTAPTACNQQSWVYYVVTNKETIVKLSEATPYSGCVKGAPLAIVICYKKNAMVPDYNHIDCAIATENLWLEADALGLGGVMIGVAPIQERMDTVGKILNLPEDEEAFTILPIGYPVKVNAQQDRYDEAKVHYIR